MKEPRTKEFVDGFCHAMIMYHMENRTTEYLSKDLTDSDFDKGVAFAVASFPKKKEKTDPSFVVATVYTKNADGGLDYTLNLGTVSARSKQEAVGKVVYGAKTGSSLFLSSAVEIKCT